MVRDLSEWLADEADRAPEPDPATVQRGLELGRARVARRRRRTGWAGVGGAVAAVAAVAVTVSVVDAGPSRSQQAGPAAPSGTATPSTPRVPDPPVRTVDGEPLLTCGRGGPGFPASALQDGVPGALSEADARAAFRQIDADPGYDPMLRFPGGVEDVEWKVLSVEGEVYELVLGPQSYQRPAGTHYLAIERVADGWRARAFGGRCSLEPVLHDDLRWFRLTSYDAPDPSSSTLTLSGHESDCSGGRDPAPYLRPVEVVETADSVTLYSTTRVDPPPVVPDVQVFVYTCRGGPGADVDVTLDEPLGDRVLRDGSTYPPRPIPTR